MLTLDPFSRLSAVTDVRCDACGAAIEHDAGACEACGAPISDETDSPGLNVLAGPASARQTFGNRSGNLEKLLASLAAVEDGEATVADAVALLDVIMSKFRVWWADLSACHDGDFWNAEEIQMHRDYVDICARLMADLATYRAPLSAGDLRAARVHMLALEEGFARLKDLKDHYAALGY